MKRPKHCVIFSEPALDDLWLIDLYLMDASPSAADKYRRLFEDAAEYLAGHPRAGHTREDLDDKSLLAWVVWPYVIVYKLEQPDVKVIRVLHGHRDIGTIMGNA